MFCADYIASFIHHGLLAGLWLEFHSRWGKEKQEHLSTAKVQPFNSFSAGCLAGEVRYKRINHELNVCVRIVRSSLCVSV